MFEVNDLLKYIPGGYLVFVTGVDRDFITVEDINGENYTVMPEDYDKYEQAV